MITDYWCDYWLRYLVKKYREKQRKKLIQRITQRRYYHYLHGFWFWLAARLLCWRPSGQNLRKGEQRRAETPNLTAVSSHPWQQTTPQKGSKLNSWPFETTSPTLPYPRQSAGVCFSDQVSEGGGSFYQTCTWPCLFSTRVRWNCSNMLTNVLYLEA